MTQEDKQLLLKDLCARLLYWPKVKTEDDDDAYIVGLDDTEKGLFYVHIIEDGDSYDTTMSVEDFKPYLRPMSSMTDEETAQVQMFMDIVTDENYGDGYSPSAWDAMNGFVQYCDSHHLDHRGLIPMGLALSAPDGMYKTQNK